MRRSMLAFVSCLALLVLGSTCANGAAAGDALKDKGLTHSGGAYVLPDETQVLDGMKELRKTKKLADAEARSRKSYEARITASKSFIKQSKSEFDKLEERLAVVRDVAVHNRIVTRLNLLIVKVKESVESQTDLQDKIAKVGSDAQMKFVDDLTALDAKAQAAKKKYEEIAGDADVKAQIAKANAGAAAPTKLGPSPEFTAALTELAKWRSAVESEAIPLSAEHGVQTLEVRLNGESHKMMLDNGSSMIALPGELAEHLKMVPGPQDPIIKMKLADGTIIEGHQMTLKSVRVGRFTVENVSCVVLQNGLNDAPALLGNSFLSHFVVKIDQKAGQLNLTEVDADPKFNTTGTKTTPGASSGAGKTPGKEF
ncbi:MAG TPA: retropepsin-like aspartic protease [Tepidisphaeraceae bacterium]|nr:retropepsin-like aspartic protease [Tepidisphaeraceae bacterium]